MTAATAPFLRLDYGDSPDTEVMHSRALPFADSELFHVKIKAVKVLTQGADVKVIYDIALDTQGIDYAFKPGDAIGVLPQNDEDEVEELLKRLDLQENANKFYKLSIATETTKKKAVIPAHIPVSGIVKDILRKHVSIRSIWKKLFLKSLLQHTTDDTDKQRIETFCSPKNINQYISFVSGEGHTLIGLLKSLPSCSPPLERLLEYLPPLHPRYYSIASSPLLKDELHFAFSVVELEDGKKGVCTGWLENCVHSVNSHVSFYFRKTTGFLSTLDVASPAIFIGPGTGVAPFIGFLQHSSLKNECTLYYGCRYEGRDHIYRNEMEGFLDSGHLTNLRVAYSRAQAEKVYVQNKIEEDGEVIVDAVLNRNAAVRVCGGGLEFGRAVEDSIINSLVRFSGKTEAEAIDVMKGLHNSDRLKMDTWV